MTVITEYLKHQAINKLYFTEAKSYDWLERWHCLSGYYNTMAIVTRGRCVSDIHGRGWIKYTYYFEVEVLVHILSQNIWLVCCKIIYKILMECEVLICLQPWVSKISNIMRYLLSSRKLRTFTVYQNLSDYLYTITQKMWNKMKCMNK